MKKELTENPEFFKAYPHMQTILNVKDDKPGASTMLKENDIDDHPYYKKDAVIGFKDPSGKNDEGYFQGLLNQHNHYMTTKEKEEAIRENERNFIEAPMSPTGPSKYLSKEELNSIHTEIDNRL